MTRTPSPYLKFQNFNSNYQYMDVHYVTVTSLPVYNLESLIPLMKILGSKRLDLVLEVHCSALRKSSTISDSQPVVDDL